MYKLCYYKKRRHKQDKRNILVRAISSVGRDDHSTMNMLRVVHAELLLALLTEAGTHIAK